MTLPSDNRFNAENHTYRGRSGLRLPGATDVIKASGLIDVTWMTKDARWRGKAVHRGVELLVKDDLEWGSVDSEVTGYLKSFVSFLATTGFIVAGAEEPCFSDTFAALPDLWGILNDVPVLIELKTGPVPDWAAFQTALQRRALRDTHNFFAVKRFGLQLMGDGSLSKLKLFDDPADDRRAMGLVDMFWWRKDHGYVEDWR